MSETGVDS